MPRYEILPATREHAEYVASHMRAPDVAEVWASSHKTPLQAVEAGMRPGAQSFAALAEGVPFAVFGVVPFCTLSDSGCPWMLGTNDLSKHAWAFLRGSRRAIEAWLLDYRLLTNYVDTRNTAAIRWLRWLGFTLEDARPYGLDGLPFHRFKMGADEA